jgi:hypothetical protein
MDIVSLRASLVVAIVAALTACATSSPPVGRRDLLEVVRPGTPRTEIMLKLGSPFVTFEGDRIMTWSIGEDSGGYLVGATSYSPGAPHPFARYELVVVFDAEGKVVKHSLVEVHKP